MKFTMCTPDTLRDYHVHTIFSDGKNTPEEDVIQAIRMGMKEIGFSDHSYTSFDLRYCMKKNKIDEYFDTVTALKQKYKQQISILCGVEQDYFAEPAEKPYDYKIGAVHYVYKDGEYFPVDEDPNVVLQVIKEHFDNDPYAWCENYYQSVADVFRKTHCDFVAHFDLVTKFNEKTPFFDPRHPRYVKAWQTAADSLLSAHIPFEINTGAISRGRTTFPYPSRDVYHYLQDKDASFLWSSDSHQRETLAYRFFEFDYAE